MFRCLILVVLIAISAFAGVPNIERKAMIMTTFGSDKLVKIKGITPSDADRFDINIRSDRDDNEALRFLHLAFHLQSQRVACNYFDKTQGGFSPASQSFWGNPITSGSAFEVIIISDVDVYKIHINGAYFNEFKKYRDDMGKEVCIDVSKDIQVTAISIEKRL